MNMINEFGLPEINCSYEKLFEDSLQFQLDATERASDFINSTHPKMSDSDKVILIKTIVDNTRAHMSDCMKHNQFQQQIQSDREQFQQQNQTEREKHDLA